MLTPEEKTERAKQISSLYPTPKPASELGPHLAESKPVNFNTIAQQGLIMGGSTAFVFAIAVAYLGMPTDSTTVAAQTGLLFILFAFGLVFGLRKGYQMVRRNLAVLLVTGHLTFFIGVASMVALCGVLYGVLFAGQSMSVGALWAKIGVSVAVLIAGGILSLIIAVKLFEKGHGTN